MFETVVGMEVRFVVRGVLKCLCKFSQLPKEVDNHGLPSVVMSTNLDDI